MTVGVMQELIRRGAIRQAVAGRSCEELQRLMNFLSRHITNSALSPTLIDVANVVLEIYSAELGTDPTLDDLFKKLHKTLEREVDFMNKIPEVLGALNLIFAASSTQTNTDVSDATTMEVDKSQSTLSVNGPEKGGNMEHNL